jgi:hypothetical protein
VSPAGAIAIEDLHEAAGAADAEELWTLHAIRDFVRRMVGLGGMAKDVGECVDRPEDAIR